MASRERRGGAARGSRAHVAAAGTAGLLIGLVAGALAGIGSRGADGRPPTAAATDGTLREALDRERREREALEAEVAVLRAALASAAGDEDETPRPEPADAGDEGTDPDATQAEGTFDAEALEALGFYASEVARLRERYERFELDRLYLDNTARREGWRYRARFRQARGDLWEDLRADLSEPEYDATLYAAGRKNRVIVSDVLANSAAEAAGLRPGDVLYRYDGQRIFDAFSLVRATADGEAGSLTELRIRRDGEEIRLFLPRGPLGVRLSRALRPPDPPR